MDYYTLVFRNLESNSFRNKYIMMTVPPRWQSPIPEVDERGFVTYEEVKAGDNYYNRDTGTLDKYNYTNIYFIKFIKERDNSKKDIII